MLRDMTLGQYYATQSPIHSLDPRTKLASVMLFIISLFVADNFWCYIIVAVYMVTVIKMSKVPLSFITRGMKAVTIILTFTILFNLFLTPGEPVVEIWKISITKEGIVQAAFMAIRLSFLIIGTSLMTFTTTPTSLTDGLEKSLGFLRVIHIPVHEIAMMMSIALRFIPILTEETDKIMKAQTARGADFESGGIIKRAKALVPILVPLFISAFRRASDLAQAMEARCYHGGAGRTKMHPLKYKKADAIAYISTFIYFAGVIVLSIFF